MSFLNTMMNRAAMDDPKHGREMAGMSTTCRISNNEYTDESVTHGFYASCQVGI